MSVSDEEPYSTIFASLKHPIRRRILRMLSKNPMSFLEMVEVLGVSSPFLTYHLENLGELVGKNDDGKYRLSTFGEAATATMTKVEDIPTTALRQSPPETRSQKWSRLGIFAKRFKAAETEPRKVVSRSVAIALAMMCIVLAAGTAGAIIYYNSVVNDKNKMISSQNSQASSLQNQNKQLQTWLNGNDTLLDQTQANDTDLQNQNTNLTNQITDQNNTISSLNTQISQLNSNLANLQNQLDNFQVSGAENSSVWVNSENVIEPSGGIVIFGLFSVPSEGYVSIRVTSNSNSTYVTPYNFQNGTYINGTLTYDLNTLNSVVVGFGGTVVFYVLSNSMLEITVGNSFGEATQTVTITYYH